MRVTHVCVCVCRFRCQHTEVQPLNMMGRLLRAGPRQYVECPECLAVVQFTRQGYLGAASRYNCGCLYGPAVRTRPRVMCALCEEMAPTDKPGMQWHRVLNDCFFPRWSDVEYAHELDHHELRYAVQCADAVNAGTALPAVPAELQRLRAERDRRQHWTRERKRHGADPVARSPDLDYDTRGHRRLHGPWWRVERLPFCHRHPCAFLAHWDYVPPLSLVREKVRRGLLAVRSRDGSGERVFLERRPSSSSSSRERYHMLGQRQLSVVVPPHSLHVLGSVDTGPPHTET